MPGMGLNQESTVANACITLGRSDVIRMSKNSQVGYNGKRDNAGIHRHQVRSQKLVRGFCGYIQGNGIDAAGNDLNIAVDVQVVDGSGLRPGCRRAILSPGAAALR